MRGPESTPEEQGSGRGWPGSASVWRSYWVSMSACVILAVGGVLMLASFGQARGAWFLGLTQGLCLLLSVSAAGTVREALRREPGWQLGLSWVLSVGFIGGVVALYWAGRGFWAELLMAVVTVLYVASVGLVVFFPGLVEAGGDGGGGGGGGNGGGGGGGGG